MPKITKIPASISRYTSAPIDAPVKRKVAAYARVSTDSEEQLTSYAAQISYYTEYIKGREDWEFDLDRFKEINAVLGQSGGDAVLKASVPRYIKSAF